MTELSSQRFVSAGGRNGRNGRRTAPAAPSSGLLNRLLRIANMPFTEALASMFSHRAAPRARIGRDFEPTRPAAMSETPQGRKIRAAREMSPDDACLLPNWLSSIEIVELEVAEPEMKRMFGTQN
ncbi:MAG: hypothetical protein ABW032_12030 [Burkholderiaceae bacterium]